MKLREDMNISNKILGKKILKKHVISISLTFSILFSGFITTIICYIYYPDNSRGAGEDGSSKSVLKFMILLNYIVVYVACFIVFTGIIYIFIKFLKYEMLMAGKTVKSYKDYISFCKEVFRI
ncbi:hypothetical protein PVIIG_03648 [Plasmodium vivax India VII]|uniref:Uncharacterized protein n=1 Tax=Plasmodium vivax India VII TaxID=1077284 RepID=A0A0J9V9W1_PLAVI|nr:hypothetical protein PVIIG_03648 [Plasmodium vivax India VII]